MNVIIILLDVEDVVVDLARVSNRSDLQSKRDQRRHRTKSSEYPKQRKHHRRNIRQHLFKIIKLKTAVFSNKTNKQTYVDHCDHQRRLRIVAKYHDDVCHEHAPSIDASTQFDESLTNDRHQLRDIYIYIYML